MSGMTRMHRMIQKKFIKITWDVFGRHGWGNGYVGVPKGHPWFGFPYEEIDEMIDSLIHGGLTYSEKEADGLWWVGFDTAHHGDTKDNWSEQAVRAETERLYQMAVEHARLHLTVNK